MLVKGLSRRVVVVRFPETKAFEQAIFVLREECPPGVSADQIVKEACFVANGYVYKPLKKRGLPPVAYIAAGALSTGLAWLLSVLLV